MIISLPDRYCKETPEGKYIRVSNGIMEIHGRWSFEREIIDITWKMKGRNKCFYCFRETKKEDMTMDHIYPRQFGGISITDNMVPACKFCNTSKSNMNASEYLIWKTFSQEKRREYLLSRIEEKKEKLKSGIFDIPQEWLSEIEVNSITQSTSAETSKLYNRLYAFAKENNTLSCPIIVSKNLYLLGGNTALKVAQNLNFKTVLAVIIENVVVVT